MKGHFMKKWGYYLIYSVIVFLYIYLDELCYGSLQAYVQKTFQSYLVTFFFLISNMLFGVILGLEHFVIEKRKKGKWKFNIPRFILLGLPGLVLGLSYVWNYDFSAIDIFSSQQAFPLIVFLSQILAGYITISNFHKEDGVNEY